MIRVYLERRFTGYQWADLLTSVWSIREPKYRVFRYCLLDVGLSKIINQHGRLIYTRDFVDHYCRTVQDLDRRYPGRVKALIPDVPPLWGEHRIRNWRERHYALLRQWQKRREEYWVPIVHYFTLDEEQMEKMLDEQGGLLAERGLLAVPARRLDLFAEKFVAMMKLLHRKFPSLKLHLLGFYPRSRLDFKKDNVVSVDLGHAVVNFGLLKLLLTGFLRLKQDERWMFVGYHVTRKGLECCSAMFMNAIILYLRSVFGEVDYAGWISRSEPDAFGSTGGSLCGSGVCPTCD